VATIGRQERKTKLIARAHLIERREGGNQLGRREPQGKTYFHEDVTDARARWAGQGGFGLREERVSGAGWANGRMGRKVGRAECKEKEFLD
jgi:hypothetical protein